MLYFWETGEMGWGSSSLRWPTRFLEDPADNGPSLVHQIHGSDQAGMGGHI